MSLTKVIEQVEVIFPWASKDENASFGFQLQSELAAFAGLIQNILPALEERVESNDIQTVHTALAVLKQTLDAWKSGEKTSESIALPIFENRHPVRSVAELPLHSLGMLSSLNPQSNIHVPKIVNPNFTNPCLSQRRFEHSSGQVLWHEWFSVLTWEDQIQVVPLSAHYKPLFVLSNLMCFQRSITYLNGAPDSSMKIQATAWRSRKRTRIRSIWIFTSYASSSGLRPERRPFHS